VDNQHQAGSTPRLFLCLVFLAVGVFGCQEPGGEQQDSRSVDSVATTPDKGGRPNILVVVVDDMGYSDIGAFGGEIPTPNLDRLAYAGTRFTDFQVLPACSPTRATLLTGREPHAVGFGSLAEEIADNQKVSPAYSGALPPDAATLPRVLAERGYRSYMAGKWHLGFEQGRGPAFFGFDRSVALLAGGASHFADMKPAYAPDPDAVADYVIDDQPIDRLPEDFRYSSQFYADRMIDYIGEGDDRPFFAYLSFTAPHWPLQAPDASIERFAQDYVAGYEVLRERRLTALRELGLVPASAVMSGLPPKVRPWDSLTGEERDREARAMAVYAAMIHEVDRHVGRVIDHLERIDALDNTAIVFLSDNGAEGHDLDETWPGDLFPEIRAVIDERFDHSTPAMGRPGSYTLYGAGWAHAAAPHLRLYKGFPTEGGTRVAAFVKLPGDNTGPAILRDTVSIRDLYPTVLDIVGGFRTEDPQWAGQSILPQLTGERTEPTAPRIAVEFLGKVAVREGDWKLVKLPPPYGSGEYALYDLGTDLAESIDVAAQHPDRVARLVELFEGYAQRHGVIHPDWVSGY